MEIISGVKAENRPSIGTDSIMRLIALVIVAIAVSSADLSVADETLNSFGNLDVPAAAVKLDKNLRRALLKALTDLEAESAEQRKDDDQPVAQAYTAEQFQNTLKKDLNENIAISPKSSFSFKGFPGDEEIPSEDKLQNSSFIETNKYNPSGSSSMTIEKASNDDARSFHIQNVIMPDKSLRKDMGPMIEQSETKKSNVESRDSYVNKVESVTLQPVTQLSEGLTGVASNGIAVAKMLPAPKPTASSPIEPPRINGTDTNKNKVIIEKSEEVKIFQAPLVAAFTVQQDESGAPKSVVPIFRPSGDGQALTLQEQLEFKQKLLEKQLEELQQQQIQQTHFLIRQRQLYEQQVRQKQQQQYYLQEQARIKQIEEQARMKQLEEQRLKQFEDPRIYRFQQQVPSHQQKHRFFEQATNLLSFQTPGESTVRLQPSVSLEVPNTVVPPPFQVNYQEQLRLQQLRQQQQQQHLHQQQQQQHLQQQQQQQQQHLQQQQQRLQQSFGPITDFQPPVAASTRFNRQEAFNSVGNFGFNEKPTVTRNSFAFGIPQRTPVNTVYNPYVQYRQTRPQQTPAKQIQNLLYQSGIAGDLGNAHGSGGQEDLNIVSKVLALNVGHIPNQNLHYTTSNRGINNVGHASA